MTGLGPILVVGAEGMLGRAWCRLLAQHGISYEATSRPVLDLAHASTIDRVVTEAHPIVVNCAAWTDVDGAERQEATATTVNGVGVGLLAERCRALGSSLLHYSTDYVFDGDSSGPFAVDHPRSPMNAYGRSKALGEHLLQASGCRHLLVRTSWLYAPWGNNFVRTIAHLSRERTVLSVVADQRGRPTSAEHLASASLALLQRGATGSFHVCDGGECTWFDFASEIVRILASSCQVEPCTTEQFPRPARRPPYSVLDLAHTEALLGPMPHWTRNLADVLARMHPEPSGEDVISQPA